jgi:HD-GYP domain-containing protein (c-di-GMP phosphodiesterase class II)
LFSIISSRIRKYNERHERDNEIINESYRNRLTKEDILNELENNKGTQFDPKIADVMLKLLKNGEIRFDD